jgi:hypothetical protein
MMVKWEPYPDDIKFKAARDAVPLLLYQKADHPFIISLSSD